METRPLSTSQLLDNRKLVVTQPSRHTNPAYADMQVMKGGQIQASGLDHPVGWPRSHVAVVTEGYVPVVCESEAQRLAPI